VSKIYPKPKVGDVVIWKSSQGQYYADTVTLVGELNRYHYTGSYLRNIYLRGGCMTDQRSLVAVFPPGTIIDQCTFDSSGYQGYTKDRNYASDRDEHRKKVAQWERERIEAKIPSPPKKRTRTLGVSG
jgi:hypothetical protein